MTELVGNTIRGGPNRMAGKGFRNNGGWRTAALKIQSKADVSHLIAKFESEITRKQLRRNNMQFCGT
jgi:hypothetical protein